MPAVFREIRWASASTIINAALQIGVVTLQARLLDPSAFGLMAIAQVVLRFVSYFAHLGIGPSLQRMPRIDRADIQTANAVIYMVGSAMALVLVALSPLIAAGLNMPEATPIIQFMTATLVLWPLSSIPDSVLRKRGDFKTLALIEITSYAVAYLVVSLALSWAGYGVWALVIAFVVQPVVMLTLGLWVTRGTLWPKLDRARVPALVSFGARFSLIAFMEFLTERIDSIVIGRMFGAAPLGFFNRAQMLVRMPAELAISSVTKVLYPRLSDAREDRVRLSSVWQVMFFVVTAAVGAGAALLVVLSDQVVLLLLGPKWTEAAPLMRILAFSIPPLLLVYVTGMVYDAYDFLNVKIKLTVVVMLVKIALVTVAAQSGIEAVGWAVAAIEIGRAGAMITLLHTLLPVSGADTVKLTLWALAIICAVAGLTWLVKLGLVALGAHWLVVLFVAGLIGAAAAAAAIWLCLKHNREHAPFTAWRGIGFSSAGQRA